MSRKFLVADLFCGAGGFTAALFRELEAQGIECELVAINHNPVAIATHSKNHPRARHVITDLTTADPEKLVPEGRLDLLLASPTCTFHSRARGGKPTSDQERMDPWVITAWCTKLRVQRLLVENVPEFVEWGPIDPRTGRPVKSRKGEYFNAWRASLRGIGFNTDHRVLTAADFGDATTRRRFFMAGRADKRPVNWPEPTHSREGVRDLFGTRKRWRAAREIINWTDKGRSVFDRPVPLKPNTLRRILAGALKLCGPWAAVFVALLQRELYRSILYHEGGVGYRPPKGKTKKKGKASKAPPVYAGPIFDEDLPPLRFVTRGGAVVRDDLGLGVSGIPSHDEAPFLVHYRGTGIAYDTTRPVPSITAQGNHFGLVRPFVFQVNQANGRHRSHRTVDLPLFAVLTRDTYGLADFELDAFTCANRTNNAARSTRDPLHGATTTTGGGIFLIRPGVFMLAQGSNGAPQSTDADPVPTVTTVSRIQLVEPVGPFVLGQHGGATARTTQLPIPTIATGGAISLIEPIARPFVLNRHGDRATGGVRGRPVTEPLFAATGSGAGYLIDPYLAVMKGMSLAASIHRPAPGITTKRHLAVIDPFIAIINHGGGVDRQAPKGITNPLPAIATHNGFSLIEPFIAPYYGSGSGTTGRTVALPVPAITTKDRWALVMPSFLVPQFGERPEQSPRFHVLDLPFPAVTGHGAGALVSPYLMRITRPLWHGGAIRRVEAPVPTITRSKGGEYALVEPFVISTRHHREGWGPQARSVEQPLATISGTGRGEFKVVSPTQGMNGGRVVYVDDVAVIGDILFRMLRNAELAAAMSFTDDEYTYEFTGTETEITKQIGNAVPVKTARALIRAGIQDLIPSRTNRTASAIAAGSAA